MNTVLITGGAGYIGSHVALKLFEYEKCEIIIFDNLSTGHLKTVETLSKYGNLKFFHGDLLNKDDLTKVFKENTINSVIHLAAFSEVEESVKNPEKYYVNNVCGTLNLLTEMKQREVKKIVFSSTAAIYGNPLYTPIDENHVKNPISPYGQTKMIIENILDDYDKAYGLKSVRLRYFNVAGADNKARIGEWHNNETHLIPNILKSVLKKETVFQMFGDDYNTRDGSCIRDYINVEDLACAHILALKYLDNGGKTDYFNLGTKEGTTVKEVLSACEKITGKPVSVNIKPRRNADPPILIADNEKAEKILGWKPQNAIDFSIKTAYEWEKNLLNIK